MKKRTILIALTLLAATCTFAQSAKIKFQHTTYDFGVFVRDSAILTHNFVFTNTGDAPLIIHQAVASCGCTVPEFTLAPINPGEKGTVKVTYNGKRKRAGKFRKSISIVHNGKHSPVRLYVEGEMFDEEVDLQRSLKEKK